MSTEVLTLPNGEEDQEEGEIIDVEAYENNMELESISSEEEENLKDRIRELETRNKELEKLAAVAKEERRTYNYDNTDFVTISSEEEEFFGAKFIEKSVVVKNCNGRRNNGISRGRKRKTNLRYKSPDLSPDFKRRRRSMSPEYYQRPRIDHNRDRVSRYEQSRSREHKKKKKRSGRRQYSDTESDNEKYVRSQLNAALKRDTRVSTLHEDNPLMRKLRLRPGSANKENERSTTNGDRDSRKDKDMEEEDDELIALRLQALKSKQEVKELIKEIPLPDTVVSVPKVKADDFDQEELELRMIALKSAIVKKAVARKKQNEKPYSPTDGLEWTPASPDNPYASSESNMQISPAISPTLDDAVLQPIDMEIATPDNMSNSPTFYSFEDSSTKVSTQLMSLEQNFITNPWPSVMPPTMIIPVVISQPIVPFIPKTMTTKNGIPLEFLSRPVRDELINCRSNTQSPTCNQTANITDINLNLRPRSRSLDSLQTNVQSTKETEVINEASNEKTSKKPEAPDDDDEEEALRTLLLAKMSSPGRQPKKIVPLPLIDSTVTETLNNDTETNLDDIEEDLKKAASRFRGLSEHEEEIIEASLDKILSKPGKEDEDLEDKSEEIPEKRPHVSLKDVVERLKLSQAKEKLLKVTDETHVNEIQNVTKEDTIQHQKNEIELNEKVDLITDVIPEETNEPPKDPTPPVILEQNLDKTNKDKEESISSKITVEIPVDNKKENPTKILPSTQEEILNKLKPKQITKAMSSINAASLPKPAVLTKKPAPVIMKRKLKTNSSIINVPFQHKTTVNSTAKSTPIQQSSTTTNIPSTSTSVTTSSIVSLESVIKPVPKVIIQLGQSSSSEDSESDSDSDSETEVTSRLESAVASPSHINEFNDVSVSSPAASSEKQIQNSIPKIDPSFESKLDEFLKQARAKTENSTPNVKTGKIVPKLVQKTPSAVRHLPVSSQIEYKRLIAKMQLLEKQKQIRVSGQEPSKAGGNIKVTVENDKMLTEKVSSRKVIIGKSSARSASSDDFDTRLSKMSQEQKEKVLEKFETSYNDFSIKFETQLTEFIENISEATEEKRKQIILEMEVEELRAKLAAVESKLGKQKEKFRHIYPKITEKHKKILESRDKYVKMSKSCTKLGQTVKGTDYQFKHEAKAKIFEKLKEFPVKTKKLKNVKEDYLKELSEKAEKELQKGSTMTSNSYKSVLDCMSSSKLGTNSNNDGILCPFDLSGKCSDKECKYVHLS